MVFHWSLSDSQSPQDSRTRLSILVILSNIIIIIIIIIIVYYRLCEVYFISIITFYNKD